MPAGSSRPGSGFRARLEAAQHLVMQARHCTEDQAFDELLDVATRHHLDLLHFVEAFSEIPDHGTWLSPTDDLVGARAVAIEHWHRLASLRPDPEHKGRTTS
ncbi:ANTAR domain-containing protein [Rhodococcus sp. NPDC127530]|uniref:ANTAR domain-containing protein n=1 Tax=unclassified Rhodococcus (in: high G+C Gram-positive bacteria) TaxID=192944 RepID=UPI003629EB2A